MLRTYDDEALLREFLTPKVCELSRLYAFEHLSEDPRKIRVSSREADAIRDVLIRQHSTFGIPHIEIVDADFRGRGELLLEHRHEGVGLDEEYARGTLHPGRAAVGEAVHGPDRDRRGRRADLVHGRSRRTVRAPRLRASQLNRAREA